MNRFETPLDQRLLPAAILVALLVLLPAQVRADPGVELTPLAGFRFGGSFEDNTTGQDMDADEGAAFGLIVDVPAAGDTEYELFYSFQRTKLKGDGIFAGGTLLDLDIHYLHAGGLLLFPRERARPFVGGGLGVTWFSPRGFGLDSDIRFSLSLGGGVKIPVSERIGLRFEGRGFLTFLPASTDLFCVSSGGAACDVRVRGDVFGQVELLAGISFRL